VVSHAPLSVIVVPVPVATGDNGAWSRARPDFRRHKAQRPERWPPKQNIPRQLGRDDLRRRVEENREATRSRVEALNAAGRAFRAALRAA
jgi:hypothetical protein